jgi:hypothetical protein
MALYSPRRSWRLSDCITNFELHKIYDIQLTQEETDDLALAGAVVRAFLTWEISPEAVDVALQVRDMLDTAEMNIEEAREGDEEGGQAEGTERGEAAGQGEEGEEDSEEASGVAGGGRVAEVVESDEEEDQDNSSQWWSGISSSKALWTACIAACLHFM